VAVIRIEAAELNGEQLTTVPLGRSSGLQVGEWVMAVGAPFGLKQTVSAGIVSALGRGHMGITDYEDFIQTDAAINPGNSGGPLVNLEGELVGINTAIASRTGGNQGIGFAVPIDMARHVMEQLIATGSVTRGYIGLMIGDLSPSLAASFEFTGKDGVLVQDVTADGPGAAAGIKPGDIIFSRDGKPVDDVGAFRNGIASTAPGTTTKLEVWRDGKATSIDVKLGKLPGESATLAQQSESEGVAKLGVALTEVPPELRAKLGSDAKGGALVASVEPGSPAEEAGLKRGDVILEVGASKVTSASDAQSKLASGAKDKPVRLRVVREGHGMFVIVPGR
jgi:serine protease Do